MREAMFKARVVVMTPPVMYHVPMIVVFAIGVLFAFAFTNVWALLIASVGVGLLIGACVHYWTRFFQAVVENTFEKAFQIGQQHRYMEPGTTQIFSVGEGGVVELSEEEADFLDEVMGKDDRP